jgi:hypothetical protein
MGGLPDGHAKCCQRYALARQKAHALEHAIWKGMRRIATAGSKLQAAAAAATVHSVGSTGARAQRRGRFAVAGRRLIVVVAVAPVGAGRQSGRVQARRARHRAGPRLAAALAACRAGPGWVPTPCPRTPPHPRPHRRPHLRPRPRPTPCQSRRPWAQRVAPLSRTHAARVETS